MGRARSGHAIKDGGELGAGTPSRTEELCTVLSRVIRGCLVVEVALLFVLHGRHHLAPRTTRTCQ